MDRLDGPRPRPSCAPSRVAWLTPLGSWVFERCRSHPQWIFVRGSDMPHDATSVHLLCSLIVPPVLKQKKAQGHLNC